MGRYPSARYSLMALRPLHRRKHQIRRHLNHVFHPVLGDSPHGDGRHNRFFRIHLHCHRLMLSPLRLKLMHPLAGTPMDLRAAPDAVFQRVLDQLCWGGIEIG